MRIRIWNGIAVGFDDMIQRDRFDHRVDLIAITESVFQGLEQNGPHPFSRDVSIPSSPKTPTPSVARGKLSLAQAQIFIGMYREIDPSGDRRIDLAFPELFAREMNRRQGRRAHGIYRDARPMKVEEVRDPISDRSVGRTRDGCVAGQKRLSSEQFILPPHDPHINAYAASCDALFGIAGVLDRLPCGFEKYALLRID